MYVCRCSKYNNYNAQNISVNAHERKLFRVPPEILLLTSALTTESKTRSTNKKRFDRNALRVTTQVAIYWQHKPQ